MQEPCFCEVEHMYFSRSAGVVLFAACLSTGLACTESEPDNAAIAENVIGVIVGACPPAPSDDAAARRTCAERLSSSLVMNDSFAARIAFGGQQEPNSYAYNRGLTHLASRVALRIYIPLFYAT